MNNIAIRVEGLGKRYRIGELQQYKALRDTLTDALYAPFRGISRLVNPISQIRYPKSDNHIWALKDVSFEVKQGEVIGIIGRNGAGKSTLLKILSRITEPTEGKAEIHGRLGSLLEVGTGFHPELTGRENIFLNGAILGMKKVEIIRKFDEMVAFADIEKFIDTPVKFYSSGMYVRLAFAVAAHLEPEILLVDEVLAVGDAAFQKKCLGKMGDISKEGRTVLFVSHNMASMRRLCPFSLWLDAGQIKDYGDTPSIINTYLASIDNSRNTHIATGAPNVFPEDASKKSQFRSARLLNKSGIVTQKFSCDEPIIIELEYQVRRPVPGLYAYLSVSRDDGTVVLVSISDDTEVNHFDNLPVGTHRIRATIPPRILGHGDYRISVSTGSPFSASNHLNIVDAPGVVALFRLDDHTSIRGNKRGGFLSTLLGWSIYESKKP